MSFLLITEQPPAPTNPCQPSPCGPNAECQVRGDSPACSCIANYIGVPPNCRPECTINPECPPHLACMQKKCRDPCVGLCGSNAQCSVVNHHAVCACAEGYTGNPFSTCEPVVKGEYTYKEKEFFVSFLSFFFSLRISPIACRRKTGKCFLESLLTLSFHILTMYLCIFFEKKRKKKKENERRRGP